MGADNLTIQDVIARNKLMRGNEIGFVHGHESWTFSQYELDVLHLAAGLAALGIRKGDRVAVIALNCYEFFLLFGAASYVGIIVVPINWRLNSTEIRVILEDCRPVAVVVSKDYVEALVQAVNTCQFVEHRFVIEDGPEGFRPLSTVGAASDIFRPERVSHADGFVMIYTAAIEGRPKGALLTHGNIIASSLQVIVPMEIRADDIYLNLMPLFHVMGLELAMSVMFSGGRNVIVNKFDPAEAVTCILRDRVTIIPTVPPMLASILDHAERSGSSLDTIRLVPSLFDHPETIQRCQLKTRARFWCGFGQTENTGYLTLCPYDENPGSSGQGGPMVRVQVVDDYDRQVPVGTPGEIVARGPVIFGEYWNLQEETTYALREGWLHTGDIGRMDEKGYLWYVGRKAEKELIKPGGENVYPIEVEKALLEHGDVLEACVFGVPDKQWGEAVSAVCVLKAGSQLKSQELIDFVGSRIARYKKPKYVSFVENLPHTAEGVIDRLKVKAGSYIKSV